MRLLIATRNPGKKREYEDLLGDLGYDLVTLDEVGIDLEVAETGTTYAENAALKARGYAAASGLITLADDSGLEVDALGGAPGVLSARYAGDEATDADRYEKLLGEMRNVPDERRTAHFRCVIVVTWPDGHSECVEGTCEGRITREPCGNHGFGFDPVFYLPELGCTMAELPPEVKNRISHRARAAQAIRPKLKHRIKGEG